MKIDWSPLLLLLLFLSGATFLSYHSSILSENKAKACQEIGFESYFILGGVQYCDDLEGNLYSVKMDCNWLGDNCKAKQIEIRSYKE